MDLLGFCVLEYDSMVAEDWRNTLREMETLAYVLCSGKTTLIQICSTLWWMRSSKDFKRVKSVCMQQENNIFSINIRRQLTRELPIKLFFQFDFIFGSVSFFVSPTSFDFLIISISPNAKTQNTKKCCWCQQFENSNAMWKNKNSREKKTHSFKPRANYLIQIQNHCKWFGLLPYLSKEFTTSRKIDFMPSYRMHKFFKYEFTRFHCDK